MPDIDNLKALFGRALTLPDGEVRRAWLQRQCAADPALLEEVSSLLEAYGEVEKWTPGTRQLPLEIDASIPDARFGPYRAVALLGRGGTSSVYRAARVDGKYQQSVALKVMSTFLNGPDFQRRFETERQLLASLNHPYIAHLLDGGTSSSGHPYLAMEYVEGDRLDLYCDRHKLDIQARLRLFLQVCQAVDYVHRNLIVHRDLKPTNILVTAEGNVKLLDFGTGALLETQIDATVTRNRMMTPRYASPERLRGEPAGISDDVFSLGIILYELLTGVWPFGDPNSTLTELKRALEKPAPLLPTSVVTAQAAQSRGVRLRALRKQLRTDLGAIVLKALEQDALLRYKTVRDLSTDLNNYLLNLPVGARRPTFSYRAGKFLRRNWAVSFTAALLAIGLSAATAVSISEARAAHAEALKADSVNQFFSGMLSSFSKFDFDGEKFTVVQMLAAADRDLETGPRKSPLIEATLRRSLAESYIGLSRFADARRQLDRAIPMLSKLADQRELAAALATEARIDQNDGNLEAAVRHLEQSLDLLRALGNQAPNAAIFEAKLSLAEALSGRAGVDRDRGRARHLVEEAIAAGTHDSSIPRTRQAKAMSDLGELLASNGQNSDAEEINRQALAIGRQEQPGGSWELEPLYELQMSRERAGDIAGARELARQEVEVMEHNVGPNHLMTAVARVSWGRLAARDHDVSAAAKAVDEAMPIIAKEASTASPNFWIATRDAAVVMRLAGRLADAEGYARQSLQAAQAQHLADSDPRLANSWQQLGNALAANHKIGDGLRCLERARTIYGLGGPNWAASEQAVARRIAELRAATPPVR